MPTDYTVLSLIFSSVYLCVVGEGWSQANTFMRHCLWMEKVVMCAFMLWIMLGICIKLCCVRFGDSIYNKTYTVKQI